VSMRAMSRGREALNALLVLPTGAALFGLAAALPRQAEWLVRASGPAVFLGLIWLVDIALRPVHWLVRILGGCTLLIIEAFTIKAYFRSHPDDTFGWPVWVAIALVVLTGLAMFSGFYHIARTAREEKARHIRGTLR